MARKCFSTKFTHMWWTADEQSGQVHVNAKNASKLQDQLFVYSHLPWHRVVCNNWWGKPITDLAHVFKITRELNQLGHEQFFITRRGVSSASYGVQIWCAEPEMPFVIMMCASPVVSMRSYTPDQFEDQIMTMCTWSTF